VNYQDFFAELKRRNVYKVAVAYAVVGWLVIQVTATIVPALHLPDGLTSAVVVLVLVGFVIALVIAWAFESSSHGIDRTMVADALKRRSRGHVWIYVAVIGATASIGLFLLGRYSARTARSASDELRRDKEYGAAIPQKSIAVLPFENLSDDKSNAYFADGVQEEILTRLSKIAELKVISRTSTQRFKSASLSERNRETAWCRQHSRRQRPKSARSGPDQRAVDQRAQRFAHVGGNLRPQIERCLSD